MNYHLETVQAVCNQVRHKAGQSIRFQDLLRKIRKEFKSYKFDIKIYSHQKSTLDAEEFYVNAYYDPEADKDFEDPFEVVIFHNFNKTTMWDRPHITNLLIQIFDAVVHELRHQKQSQKKHHNIYWKHSAIIYNYLSDPDEVDAYAISIAIELCRNIGKQRALNHMHRFTAMSRYRIQKNLISPNLYAYVKVFEDVNHPTLRRLAKKIYHRLNKIDTDLIFL